MLNRPAVLLNVAIVTLLMGCRPSPSSPSSSERVLPGPSSGVNGTYLGTTSFVLVRLNGAEVRTLVLHVRQDDETLSGDWVLPGSCCEGGPVDGTLQTSADGLQALRLHLPSIDFDLTVQGTLTSPDGSSFSGAMTFCGEATCLEPPVAGTVTFVRR